MLFTSSVFVMLFLPLLLGLYFLVPQRFLKYRNAILLLFSLIFYGWSGVRYLLLLFVSISVNYLGGLLIGRAERKLWRRFWLAATVFINLTVLGYFKYAGFAARSINALGITIPIPAVVLPVGISFFTFQGMSYVIDVFRRNAQVQKNPAYVALYISLFPQLVAGPIVRYTTIEHEITARTHSAEDFSAGAIRFMLGFGKKMLLANTMGIIADDAFGRISSGSLPTSLAWLGALAYTLQIYYDFSAYSDMAIGLGRIFGFHFLENFNYPYISYSVQDFWRRWHISLSTWFRDYVYIPLGGSRCSAARNIFNMSVVWLLTGLWHGANWTFILWGVFYGLLLVLEKYVLRGVLKHTPRFLRHLLTLLIVVIGWVLFRSDSIAQAGSYLRVMFFGGGSETRQTVYYLREYLPEFLLCLIGIFPLKHVCKKFFDDRQDQKLFLVLGHILPFCLASVAFLLGLLALASGSFNPFIYFQF